MTLPYALPSLASCSCLSRAFWTKNLFAQQGTLNTLAPETQIPALNTCCFPFTCIQTHYVIHRKLHTLANLVAHTQFLALTGDAAAPLGAAYGNIASHLQWINFRYDITGLYCKSSTQANGPTNNGAGAGADGPGASGWFPSAPSKREVVRTGTKVEETAPRDTAHPNRQLLDGSWRRGLMQVPDGPPAPAPGGGGGGGAEVGDEEQDQEDGGDSTSAEAAAYNTLVGRHS